MTGGSTTVGSIPAAASEVTALVDERAGLAWLSRWLPWPHRHRHQVTSVTYPTSFFASPPVTWVLYRCPCKRPGHLVSETLAGFHPRDVILRRPGPEEVTAGTEAAPGDE